MVQLIARSGDRRTSIEDYSGIGFESPVLAFSLSLFMLSLLGMPLTAGFMGKIMVFRRRDRSEDTTGWSSSACSTPPISAYYYLRLIIVMFFGERTTAWSAPQSSGERRAGAGDNRARRALSRNLPGRVINALQTKIESQLFTHSRSHSVTQIVPRVEDYAQTDPGTTRRNVAAANLSRAHSASCARAPTISTLPKRPGVS